MGKHNSIEAMDDQFDGDEHAYDPNPCLCLTHVDKYT